MPTSLDKAIQNAAEAFAMQVIDAVKGSSLEELLALSGDTAPKRRGRKPGPKPGAKKRGRKPGRPPKTAKRKPGRPPKTAKRKPGRPPKTARKKPGPKPKAGKKPGRKPGRPPKTAQRKITITKRVELKKKKINYPKCAHPGCKNNRWARGQGYCGEHFKMFQAGEIGPAKK